MAQAECTCTHVSRIFYDASGNERDYVNVSEKYTIIEKIHKGPYSGHDHADKCPYIASYSLTASIAESKRMIAEIEKQMRMKHTHEGNNAPRGAWAFTLTKSPKDELTVGDMIAAVKKVLTKQKSKKVIKYAWYLEYGGHDEEGLPNHPHIHGMYETDDGYRIEQKHFIRAWPIWKESKSAGAGFRGGYHRPVKHDEKYNAYIKKDGGIGESYNVESPTDQ